ncbi:expressed unknown protein [Seminavis robusta]|uniref:EF-hand domain-containing protein n=1 Tax=Seminavis robusta TaxID=568900 RepID=A0A9N8HQ87_9STRA|nr:expressed unknown protein [Seminavis robusta]|eukprot:Sro1143_g245960.1 n/a (189) ;mRNA; f:13346-14191
MKFLLPFAVLLGSFPASSAITLTEEQKKLQRFFDCIDSMEKADEDGNDRISEADEFAMFLDNYSKELFEESALDGGDVPEDMASLYGDLVEVSYPLEGETEMNIYGYKLRDMPVVTAKRLHALHSICERTAHAIMEHGHRTPAPLLVRLGGFFKAEEEELEELEEEKEELEEEKEESSSSEEGDSVRI